MLKFSFNDSLPFFGFLSRKYFLEGALFFSGGLFFSWGGVIFKWFVGGWGASLFLIGGFKRNGMEGVPPHSSPS